MALVTFESVAAAAEAISREGGKPSVRSVIAQLGGGSPNAVLPLLNEWKSGRVAVRSADIELDPRIGQIVAELVTRASDQAAKSAEERAADVQADAETVAEAGREAELRAEALEGQLEKAIQTITLKERALEDAQAAAAIEAKNAQDKATALQNQLSEERSRADQAVQAVAKAEVRLELIPGLQAEVERLKPFEQQAAVLSANLDSAKALIDDLKARLSESLADAKHAHEELEKVRISERSLEQTVLGAARESQQLAAQLNESKDVIKMLRDAEKEARDETKEVRAQLAKVQARAE
uniref:DNA-binding protein n=1 Tax=Pseudomonas sp. TaxID=306 RepID=UPI0010B4915C|nr:DNA-binding protein [Pseudomonas sp.]QBM91819.1 capsule polysaccharide export protein [Pseudomonas sp.]